MATVVGSIWDPRPPPPMPEEDDLRKQDKVFAVRRDMDKVIREHQDYESIVRPLVANDFLSSSSPVDTAISKCGFIINRVNACRVDNLNNPERETICGKLVEAMNKCTSVIFCRHAIIRKTTTCQRDKFSPECFEGEEYLDACLMTMPDLSKLALSRGILSFDMSRPVPRRVHPGMLQYAALPPPPTEERRGVPKHLKPPVYITDPPSTLRDYTYSSHGKLRRYANILEYELLNAVNMRNYRKSKMREIQETYASELSSPSLSHTSNARLPSAERAEPVWMFDSSVNTDSKEIKYLPVNVAPLKHQKRVSSPYYNLHNRPNEFASTDSSVSAMTEKKPESDGFFVYFQRERQRRVQKSREELEERERVLDRERERHEALQRRATNPRAWAEDIEEESKRRDRVLQAALKKVKTRTQIERHLLNTETFHPLQRLQDYRKYNFKMGLSTKPWQTMWRERIEHSKWVAKNIRDRLSTHRLHEDWPAPGQVNPNEDPEYLKFAENNPLILNWKQPAPLPGYYEKNPDKYRGIHLTLPTPSPAPSDILAPDPFDPYGTPAEYSGVYPPPHIRPVSTLADAMYVQAMDRHEKRKEAMGMDPNLDVEDHLIWRDHMGDQQVDRYLPPAEAWRQGQTPLAPVDRFMFGDTPAEQAMPVTPDSHSEQYFHRFNPIYITPFDTFTTVEPIASVAREIPPQPNYFQVPVPAPPPDDLPPQDHIPFTPS